ncbi:MAG: aminotransferase class III-fold pyridoxal phosphate-dependent enzyme [Flavihumibacter sp.]
MFISLPALATHLNNAFGLRGELQALNGYDEQNALLTTAAGQRYICKLAGPGHDRFLVEAQLAMMHHLHAKGLHQGFQQPFPAQNGALMATLEIDGQPFFLRVFNFLEGNFLVNEPVHSVALLTDIGRSLGQMDTALADFHHPAFRRYYEWDIGQAADARQWLEHITDPAKKRLVSYFLLQFETEVLPQLNSLRKACIHNDANDYNLLVKEDRFAGLIDFGDAVYAPVINNLAVAITYAMLSKPDPLSAAAALVKGYHEAYPLTTVEIDLLYYLVAGRLCISLGKSAYNKAQQSDNEHHFITEAPAWQLIGQWIEINPLRAAHAFRSACGRPPVISGDTGYEPLLQRRHDHVGRNLSISYRRKLKIVKGALQYLYDDQGNTYVDCVNNVSHVGHCHPEVVRPMQKQLAALNTNTRYLSDHLVEYAERLTATLPPRLKVCYFTNSGSEANDLAIRMSRHFTGQKDVIVLDHAYHGTSTVAMEMSPYKFDGKGGFGRMPYIHKAMNPDGYRGPFTGKLILMPVPGMPPM